MIFLCPFQRRVGKSQKVDSSLSALWDEVRDVAQGYFVQGDLLVCKWLPCIGDCGGGGFSGGGAE